MFLQSAIALILLALKNNLVRAVDKSHKTN